MSQKKTDKMISVRELLESIYLDIDEHLFNGLETTIDADRLQKTAIQLVDEALLQYKEMAGLK